MRSPGLIEAGVNRARPPALASRPPPIGAPRLPNPLAAHRQIRDAQDIQAAMAAIMALYQSGVI